MQLPYGAVYFRKSNPPCDEWERDYKQAAKDGNNIFRHWFMWGSIEVQPGVFDWDDYDRQMDLAAANNIKIIAAEISTSVPEWLYAKYPELLHRDSTGQHPGSDFGGSSATGGFCGGLCLDHEDSKKYTGRFLKELASRYRNHPALLGYDIWNECNTSPAFCHCEHTAARFRHWLAGKYGSLKNLAQAWHRYSYSDWNEVKIPNKLLLAPECFDWLEFKKENAYEQFKWRINTLREVDRDSLMCAHGMAFSLEGMANHAADDWLAAEQVDVYGLTFVQSRKGAQDWKQFQAVDLTRSASNGKPFWHAEAQGGPLWLQPQVPGRPREDGRITTPDDLRIWNMTSFAAGARGLLYPRWRPLLDGPLFGAFGPYGMDGLPTPCSDRASEIAVWANQPEQKSLFEASPVRGKIGLVVVPEAQIISLLLSQSGGGDHYKLMMAGAYKAFFDQNIQTDFVRLDDIEDYKFLYLAYPLMLKKETVEKLFDWVQKGGKLICEGCPAYFGEHGHVGVVQPNYNLDQLFGVKQDYVEFTPDILTDFTFEICGKRAYGAEYLQTYQLDDAEVIAALDDKRIIAAEKKHGDGSAILIGTCLSKGYYDHPDSENASILLSLFQKTGFREDFHMDNNHVRIRLHMLGNRLFIWALNTTTENQTADLKLAEDWLVKGISSVFWQGGKIESCSPGVFRMEIEAKNCIIWVCDY